MTDRRDAGGDEGPGGDGGGPRLATLPGVARGTHVTLAQNLERTNRHPVLIFGSSGSGKSSLILSFIRTLQASRTVDIEFGEPVLDRAHPKSAEKHSEATRFYDWQTYLMDRGEPAHRSGLPFFVPIDVKPRNSRLPPVKFAFLDGRGEDYQPDENPEANLYKPLFEEIRNLLQTFSYGITIICVAPYSISDGHDRDTRDSNFGLLGAMRGYRELRKLRRNDFHLFLLTKWDQRAPPLDPQEQFDRVYPGDVDTVLQERYRQSWGDFQALPLEGEAKDRRAFMQYSSGYYVDGYPHPPPDSFVRSFEHYPRTILNWLYGNATQFRIANDKKTITLREILFEDVVPPGEPRVTLTDFFAGLLTSR